MCHASIHIRTEEHDYSDIPDLDHGWSRSVYGELSEFLPQDAPKPLWKYVTLTHYVDANLMNEITTGRSVMGILHVINKTPSTGSPRSKLQLQQPRMDRNLSVLGHLWNKSLT
jgi:hypothetical protein